MTLDTGRSSRQVPEYWIAVTLPYATFGLGVRAESIMLVPPVARWTWGKPVHEVLAFYRSKGGRCDVFTSGSPLPGLPPAVPRRKPLRGLPPAPGSP